MQGPTLQLSGDGQVMQAGIVLQGLGGLPVVSAWVSTEAEKNFAFVEFRYAALWLIHESLFLSPDPAY